MNKKFGLSIISVLLALWMALPFVPVIASDPEVPDEEDIPTVVAPEFESDAKSLILMEAATGKILYEKNSDEALPPASVTKIMTLLLVMEAVDRGAIAMSDPVTVSEAAASMGGSQVYLKAGEVLTVEEMIKCVVIASANDAALALAELIAGSEESFVALMNARAKELGMVNSHFENTNGLDDTTQNHVLSAEDIAIMSAELLKHTAILRYTTLWQDSIRDGAFVLTNTNRLIRFYPGANGLKTGSTAKAGFCISATAKRDGMQLIAVVMGASTRDNRNAIAKQMLSWGFSSYARVKLTQQDALQIKVRYGQQTRINAEYAPIEVTVDKANAGKIQQIVQIKETVDAPVKAGDRVGTVICKINEEEIAKVPIYAKDDVERHTFGGLFMELIKKYFQI